MKLRILKLRQSMREEAQGLVEYALIIALVAVGLVIALGQLQGGIQGAFNTIIGSL